ncbi:MAG TPA: cell division protein FtsZ, partial [Cryomorphaceae bacterium]|nr:cell division protein FtsZ [Cryomorphaceae bacterium]
MIEDGIQFNLPKNRSSVIKVIGVGGGGSNAVNHMTHVGVNGVDFIVCNTDAQALYNSPVPNKVQLGASLTEGLGAGADPEIGHQAAQESITEITKMLENGTKMCFVTAGMGGGTGTGAAPVIAKAAKDMGILTVGIITSPFSFEGNIRATQAEVGIKAMRECVDSLIVINNDKLRQVYGDLGFRNAFSKADEVLAVAAKGIAEVITNHYTQNIDLRDAKTVLENSGSALFGTGTADGEERAALAIRAALDSPLLNDNHIKGAKNILLLLTSGGEMHEITIDEIGEITDHIQREAGGNANVIMGIGGQQEDGSEITCTIIATGFPTGKQVLATDVPEMVIHTLDEKKEEPIIVARPQDKVFETPEEPAAEKQEEPEDRVITDLGDFEEEETPHFKTEKEEELPADEASEINAETKQEAAAEVNTVVDGAAIQIDQIREESEVSPYREGLIEDDLRAGFPRIPEEDKAIFESSLQGQEFEDEQPMVHILEWDMENELVEENRVAEDLADEPQLVQTEEAQEKVPEMIAETEDTLPVIHTVVDELEERGDVLETYEKTDEPQGGLEVPAWDLFSQAIEPEEEEIELVIVDEVEEEPEAPDTVPEVDVEFEAPVPPPLERPLGMLKNQESHDTAFEEQAPAQATSTFTLEDIEGDGFALNLEEIEASERPEPQVPKTATSETSYEAFDLSLNDVPGLKGKAQHDSIDNSFQAPSTKFNSHEIEAGETKEEDFTLQLKVRASEQIEAPVEESLPGVNDMDLPISALKAANAGDFPKKVKERISRLSSYQYQFKSAHQIDEAERIPAYMR